MDTQDIRKLLRARDPDEITDPNLREWATGLVTAVEVLVDQVALLRRELAAARRDLDSRSGRGPGGSGGEGTGGTGGRERRPRPERPDPPREPRQRERPKRPPLASLAVHTAQWVPVDRAQLTGPGWQRWGHLERVIQDVRLVAHHTRFHLERWYSPVQRRTVVAALPPGYRQGSYGPHLQALVLQLGHQCRVTVDPLTEFLQQCGVHISAATVSQWLSGTSLLARFHHEAREVFRSGMATAAWVGHDVTTTRLNGVGWACHGFSNPRFSSFFTLPGQDGETTLRAFQGLEPLQYRWDAGADTAVRQVVARGGLTQAVLRALTPLPYGQTWTEGELATFIQHELPQIRAETAEKLRLVLAVAGYWHRPDCPTPRITVKDDAKSSYGLTPYSQLCWWHESRHVEELRLTPAEARERQQFLRLYWKLYRQIEALRPPPPSAEGAPDPAARKRYQQRVEHLRQRFRRLFTCRVKSPLLAKRMRLTSRKAASLLTVLDHPGTPMHNNGSERALRSRARKRDQSYQARSLSGLAAWDTMQGLIGTTKKLNVNFWRYLLDRLTERGEVPRLAVLVAATPALA